MIRCLGSKVDKPAFAFREVNDPMLTEMLNIVGFHITSKLSQRQKSLISKKYNISSKLLEFDSRFYTSESPEQMQSHLIAEDELTGHDLRILMQTEEELSQTKGFQRLLPNKQNSKYLKYLDELSFNDKLLSIWEEKYGGKREEGKLIIERLCKLGIHYNL